MRAWITLKAEKKPYYIGVSGNAILKLRGREGGEYRLILDLDDMALLWEFLDKHLDEIDEYITKATLVKMTRDEILGYMDEKVTEQIVATAQAAKAEAMA